MYETNIVFQNSLFLYEVQQTGVLEASILESRFVENDKIPGGWFDAGGQFKFALRINYIAILLSLRYLEYGGEDKKTGLEERYLNNFKWGID